MNKKLSKILQGSILITFLALFSGPCDPFEGDHSSNSMATESNLQGQWSGGVGMTAASKIVEFGLTLPDASGKECKVRVEVSKDISPGAKFDIAGFAHYYKDAFASGKGIDLVVLNCLVQGKADVTKIYSIFSQIKVMSTLDFDTAVKKKSGADSKGANSGKTVLTSKSILINFHDSTRDQKDRIEKICKFLELAKEKEDVKFIFSIPIRIRKVAVFTKEGVQGQKAELILQPILFTPLECPTASDVAGRSEIVGNLIKETGSYGVSHDIWGKLSAEDKTNSETLKAKDPKLESAWKELGWYAAVNSNLSVDSSKLAEQYYEGIRTARNYWLYLGIAAKEKLMLIEVQKKIN